MKARITFAEKRFITPTLRFAQIQKKKKFVYMNTGMENWLSKFWSQTRKIEGVWARPFFSGAAPPFPTLWKKKSKKSKKSKKFEKAKSPI